MSPELIAIIGAATALAAAILPGQYAMRRDVARVSAPRGTPCGSRPPHSSVRSSPSPASSCACSTSHDPPRPRRRPVARAPGVPETPAALACYGDTRARAPSSRCRTRPWRVSLWPSLYLRDYGRRQARADSARPRRRPVNSPSYTPPQRPPPPGRPPALIEIAIQEHALKAFAGRPRHDNLPVQLPLTERPFPPGTVRERHGPLNKPPLPERALCARSVRLCQNTLTMQPPLPERALVALAVRPRIGPLPFARLPVPELAHVPHSVRPRLDAYPVRLPVP